MSAFNPDTLNADDKKAAAPKIRPRRIFMAVDGYEKIDGFTYAVGKEAYGSGEPIKVRLTTVTERVADVPTANPATVESQYVSGSSHRHTLAEKEKNGVRLLSFDGALPLDNGHFRAHWPNTASTDPNAVVLTGLAHVHLDDGLGANGEPVRTAQAYIEAVKGAEIINAADDNVMAKLRGYLDTSVDGVEVKPSVQVRLTHEGKTHARARLYPASDMAEKFDEARGTTVKYKVAVDADTTIARLLSKDQASNNEAFAANRDYFRAVLVGCGAVAADAVTYETDAAKMENIAAGIEQGAIQVEMVGFERIDCGKSTRQSLLKDATRPPLSFYSSTNAKTQRTDNRYVPTAVVCQRHSDGMLYAVSVTPMDGFKYQNLNNLTVDTIKEQAFSEGLGTRQPPVQALVEEAEQEAVRDYDYDDESEIAF
jgi:hypothetical protein